MKYFNKTKDVKRLFIVCSLFLANALSVMGQGVTTAQVSGIVQDGNGNAIDGATVQAIHTPSGTIYNVYTRPDGRYNIPNMRIGGPYKVIFTYVGNKTVTQEGILLSLGQHLKLNAQLEEETVALEEVLVSGGKNALMNSEQTGAGTNISKEMMAAMPTLSRSLGDFLRLTPQSRSSSVASTTGNSQSFAGQDSRYNNLTIDGSIFNNNFGLAGSLGGQANSTPISLDAIEEIQVNIAPYDVRQAGFTGAAVNAVTRSGTNQIQGSAFYNIRNENMIGENAAENKLVINKFDVQQYGFRLGGPIVKDKLFYFINWESERRSDPTTLTAFRDSASITSNTTRVRAADLDEVSRLVKEKWSYETGPYENYSFDTRSDKAIIKLDYNLNSVHRISTRFNYLQSARDVGISNSGTLTSGSARNSLNALTFKNSNYVIHNDVYSFILELNSIFSNRISNSFSAGYTANRDYRESPSSIFPLIDILDGSRLQYITLGYEPFTPNNRLNTDVFQAQNNLNFYLKNHTVTAGLNFETFKFENLFTPLYYGQYVFNNLNDFKRALNGDSVGLARYVLNYSALPNRALPWATTKVYMPGAYLQDEISMLNNKLNLTVGLRLDVPMFGETALRNPIVDTMKFLDEKGNIVNYSTATLPDDQFMFSPRIGFNYDVFGNRTMQIRGGTGIFTGRPPFVWISNVVGNNGVLQGGILVNNTNTRAYAFTNDVTAHIPANPTASPRFNLALVDRSFKFPQVWRSDLAFDVKLPWEFVFTLEGLYTKTLNNIYYINANQELSNGNFTGEDNRPRFPAIGASNRDNAIRVYDNVTDATVLKNTNQGYTYSITGKLEKPITDRFSFMIAYNYGQAKDITSAGSIAFNSWRDNKTVNGNNLPELSFSDFDQTHRIISGLTYKVEYLKFLSTQISMFLQSGNQGRFSLFYSGDQNGDNQFGNDLLYVPKNASELSFADLTARISGRDSIIVSKQQQIDAFEQYITENEYLNANRGRVLERNQLLMKWLTTVDVSIIQEFKIRAGARKHIIQLRGDIYNFGNLISNKLGVGYRIATLSPLNATGTVDANGKPVYRFGTLSSSNVWQKPLPVEVKRTTLEDVWQAQIGIRYIF